MTAHNRERLAERSSALYVFKVIHCCRMTVDRYVERNVAVIDGNSSSKTNTAMVRCHVHCVKLFC